MSGVSAEYRLNLGCEKQFQVMQVIQEHSQLPFHLRIVEGNRFLRDLAITIEGVAPKLLFPRVLPSLDFQLPDFNFRVFSQLSPSHANWVGVRPYGLMKEEAEPLVRSAIRELIPHAFGKTALEGGNVFVFSHQGQRKAIVGELSVILTMAIGDHKGDFDALEKDRNIDLEGSPTEEGYHLAKNAELFKKERSFVCKVREGIQNCPGLQKRFVEKVSDQEKMDLREKALFWDLKRRLVLKAIASDLEVDPGCLAIIPQDAFHIDMHNLLTPDGRFGVYDPELSLSYCYSSGYTHFIETIKKGCRVPNRVQDTINAVQKIGCKAFPISGVIPGKNNHINGIFLHPKLFCTLANGIPSFQRKFSEQFTKTFEIEVIDVEDQIDINEHDGGVRCISLLVPTRKERPSLPFFRVRRAFENLFSLLTPREIKRLACTSTQLKNATRIWAKNFPSYHMRLLAQQRRSLTLTIFGDKHVAESVSNAFEGTFPLQHLPLGRIETDATGKKSCNDFSRDLFVTLPNGRMKFPKTLPSNIVESDEFRSLLYSLMRKEVIDSAVYDFATKIGVTFHGHGVSSEETDLALKFAKMSSFPYEMSEVCLEGGNVIFAPVREGPGALVGEMSVILNLAILEREGYFKRIKRPRFPDTYLPDEEDLFRARNAHLLNQGKGFYAFVPELTEKEKQQLFKEGQWWRFKREEVLRLIAKSLEIDPLHLCIVPQGADAHDYHIDMNLLLAQNGRTVFVNDYQITLELLKGSHSPAIPSLQRRIKSAPKRCDTIVKTLTQAGFDPVRVPSTLLDHEGSKVTVFNSPINSLFIRDKWFSFTSQTHDFEWAETCSSLVQLKFGQIFQATLPHVSINLVDVGFSLNHRGGVRCISNEMPFYHEHNGFTQLFNSSSLKKRLFSFLTSEERISFYRSSLQFASLGKAIAYPWPALKGQFLEMAGDVLMRIPNMTFIGQVSKTEVGKSTIVE